MAETKLFYSQKIQERHRKALNKGIRRNARGGNHYVTFHYTKEDGTKEQKRVKPFTALKSKSGNHLLVGYAAGVGLRSFRTDRMQHVKEGSMGFWNGFEKRAAELTTEKRESLPKGEFALPQEEKYPIHDLTHARNALARVSQHGTTAEREEVRRKVYAKYPELKEHFEEQHGESPTSKSNVKKEKQGSV